MTDRKGPRPLERATRAELRLRRLSVQDNALAALAVVLARTLDAGPEAKEAPGLARELRAAMVELARSAPKAEATSVVDELRAKRTARLGA